MCVCVCVCVCVQSVLWERVVVDEAHQEPKLVQNIVDLPKRSLMMLTGTPISGIVSCHSEAMHAITCSRHTHTCTWFRMHILLDCKPQQCGSLSSRLVFGCACTLQVKDMQAMLTALCMPPWETLAKSAYNMGYVLQRTMIRCAEYCASRVGTLVWHCGLACFCLPCVGQLETSCTSLLVAPTACSPS